MRPLRRAAARADDRSREPLRTRTPAGEPATYRHLARVAAWTLRLFAREEWDAAAQLPPAGRPVIVASNHVSYVDVPAVGRYLIWSGRWPRYLGKSELWRVPVLGWLGRRCLQIPVERGTARAKDALVHARAALERGECVVIYPEGGRTRDPDLWPQRGRTGVARLALATGAPVVPVAQWGTHDVMPGRRLTWPRPGQRIRIVMGDPVPLADLAGRDDDATALREATDRVLAAVTALVAELRDETPPDGVWDAREGRRVPRVPG